MSGCLVASGCCLPSASDEGGHSPKRPNSTVDVNSSSASTEVSTTFLLQGPKGSRLHYTVLCVCIGELVSYT